MTAFAPIANAETRNYHDHIIDLLRGVAALTVFVSHADQGGLLKFDFISNHKIFLGRFGVYLFFILSGYLIWRSANRMLPKPRGVAIYVIHRITRIVPLYLVNIAFVVFLLELLGSAFHPIVTTESLLRHLTFSQSLLPSVSRDLNPVLWTITHEAIYYAIVPLLFLLRAPLWGVTCLAAVFLLLDKFGLRFAVSPFLSLFYLFVIGILVAEANTAAACLGAVLLLAILRFTDPNQSYDFVPAVSAAAMFLLIWPAFGLCMRWPRVIPWTRPLCWAGVISYSLYIWHYLLVNILSTPENFGHMRSIFWILWKSDYTRALVVTGLALSVSYASYLCIEAPSMNSMRKWLTDRISQPTQSNSPA